MKEKIKEKSPLKQFYYKKNRLQQLKGFYYTAMEGSVTKAAKKMYLSQSTITLQIQTLERDLKTEVFIKGSRPLKLTGDGELLYDMASEHLKAIDELYEEFLLKKHKKKSLKISSSSHCDIISSAKIYKRFFKNLSGY